jgi:hypothetical protein
MIRLFRACSSALCHLVGFENSIGDLRRVLSSSNLGGAEKFIVVGISQSGINLPLPLEALAPVWGKFKEFCRFAAV